MRPINPKAEGLRLMLRQVLEEQVEYEPGYWNWQMETEIRDSFVEAINEWGLAQDVIGDELDRRLKVKEPDGTDLSGGGDKMQESTS